jgi:three-Cys-motif partner protein
VPGSHPVPWDLAPHTQAKHKLYEAYLNRWWPILLKSHGGGDLTYAEGFSGPGIYTKGEPGSPVIALRCLLAHQNLINTRRGGVRLLFLDHDSRSIRLLRERLAIASELSEQQLAERGIQLHVEKAACEPRLVELLRERRAFGRPMLVVLDTWGGGVTADLLRSISPSQSSEVLITVEPQFFTRFAGSDQVTHGDSVFGSRSWRAVTDQPSDRKTAWLWDQYRAAVKSFGFPFVVDFELVDKRGESLYLIFGTQHTRGLEKMKEVVWEVDVVNGVQFRDPRDPDQETFEIELDPVLGPLKRLIVEHLASQQRPLSLLELREFALYETVFKASHARAAVFGLIDAKTLVRKPGGRVTNSTLLKLRES